MVANLDQNRTIGSISFNASARPFTISSGNSSGLTLDNGGVASSILVAAGQHTVAVPLTLVNNLVANVSASGDALTLGGPISGAGQSLTKSGAGTLNLGSINSYGATSVTAGTLHVDSAGSLGSGAVAISSGATLDLAGNSAINDSAFLQLDGTATLNFVGSETVGRLYLNGVEQLGGTYGSTASGAQFQNDSFFSGTGTLTVVPEPASLSVLGLGAMAMRRRRRRA
jgi:autotransporter-associated beta strand protein